MAIVSDVSLPLSAGEDTFELHAVQLELEAVERQIRTLLEKQAKLQERQTALETSRADAHQYAGPSTQNMFIPALVHSGAVTLGTLGPSAAPGLRHLDREAERDAMVITSESSIALSRACLSRTAQATALPSRAIRHREDHLLGTSFAFVKLFVIRHHLGDGLSLLSFPVILLFSLNLI
ncbi:hypothetical protein DPX16_11624 [Anabarilius grahami]|uniref:Uncharacterized protein n=1 Tax=Anabarilius grahami TaxID=495550 RepID=A0A3N0Z5H1_ANAGA|nr:hypothetical protein DPX16_11624 [Anabarilius grahami]